MKRQSELKKSVSVMLNLIMLLACFLLFPPTVSAGNMQWSIIKTPDTANMKIVSPSEINFLAIGLDERIWASDVVNQKIYVTSDGGATWQEISTSLLAVGASLPVWNIAIAPDNPSIIAVVTSKLGTPGDVYISLDSGRNWQNLNFPAGNFISAIDISVFYGKYDIIVGTRTSTGAGKLFALQSGATATWTDLGFNGDVLALQFSPNYPSDNTLVMVYSTMTGTFTQLVLHDIANNSSNFTAYSPIEITSAGTGTSPKANQIKTASLALPLDFTVSPALNRIFVSTNDANATGNAGVFRIDNNQIYLIFKTSDNNPIHSIAYWGTVISGKLLAGTSRANSATAQVDVWYCLNPAESCPAGSCLIWQKALKPPSGGAGSGNGNALVMWNRNGTKAFCATSSSNVLTGPWPNYYLTGQALDESAISHSADNGQTWNQIGIIDTQINRLSDVQPVFDNSILYLASINTHAGPTGFDSIWRTDMTSQMRNWERVMLHSSDSNWIILRASSPVPSYIFCASLNTAKLFYSANNGQSWGELVPNLNIKDFQVSSIQDRPALFVLADDKMRTAELSGTLWKWNLSMPTGLTTGHSLHIMPNGIILVGDTSGAVSISTDYGLSFRSLPSLPVQGNVHVLIDSRVRDPYLIHAATDSANSSIYAWILGRSNAWLDMGPPNNAYFALAQLNTFYGCSVDANGSRIVRTLRPELIGPPYIEWDIMKAGLPADVVLTCEPVSMKISSGVSLWAIDNRTYSSTSGRLWHYCDCLSPASGTINLPSMDILLQAPELLTPPHNASITFSGENTKSFSIEFKWRHPTPANGYDLVISSDKDFEKIIVEKSLRPGNVSEPSWALNINELMLPSGTYYWRVRVNKIAYTYQNISGSWSEPMSFTVKNKILEERLPSAPQIIQPAGDITAFEEGVLFRWSPAEKADYYRITLAEDAYLKKIIINTTTDQTSYKSPVILEPGKTYYWQVIANNDYGQAPAQITPFKILAGDTGGNVPSVRPSINTQYILYIVIGLLVIIIIAIIPLLLRKKK